MAIILNCSCGKKIQTKSENAGKYFKCPGCGLTLQIPSAQRRKNGTSAARVSYQEFRRLWISAIAKLENRQSGLNETSVSEMRQLLKDWPKYFESCPSPSRISVKNLAQENHYLLKEIASFDTDTNKNM